MAADTVFITAAYFIIFSVIVLGVEAALVDAYLALDAPVRVALYNKLGL
jgi:hypothetical protein